MFRFHFIFLVFVFKRCAFIFGGGKGGTNEESCNDSEKVGSIGSCVCLGAQGQLSGLVIGWVPSPPLDGIHSAFILWADIYLLFL